MGNVVFFGSNLTFQDERSQEKCLHPLWDIYHNHNLFSGIITVFDASSSADRNLNQSSARNCLRYVTAILESHLVITSTGNQELSWCQLYQWWHRSWHHGNFRFSVIHSASINLYRRVTSDPAELPTLLGRRKLCTNAVEYNPLSF